MKLFAFTLDLEAAHHGLADQHQYDIFNDPGAIEEFLSAIRSVGVKITVFSVGQLFESYPDVIKIFEKYDCEFEAHSYSHDLKLTDTHSEIEKSKEAYFKYFGKNPRGYRAPQGRISALGIKNLEKSGFLYDSSVFPSYYPNPLRYLFRNRDIHQYEGSSIVEIPLTSITPFRLTLSISYIKLLGIGFMIRLCQLFGLPDTICFNSHLHDFIHHDAIYNELPIFWKLIFSRNQQKGTDYCVRFLEYIKSEGYEFCYMSELYERYKESNP